MKLLIALAVSETNVAFQMSNVNTRLNLVHNSRHFRYGEQDQANSSLYYLQSNRNIRIKRRKYGADVVSMIVGTAGFCGWGYVGPQKNHMFSVTKWSCATGYFSFGHEIGKCSRI